MATGWKLDDDDRRALLARYPPACPEVVADHVTLAPDAADDTLLPGPVRAAIVGEARDEGLQALVVAIDGSTDRPDGGTWHVTWSLGGGREASESNTVLATRGWERIREPVPIRLHPARWD